MSETYDLEDLSTPGLAARITPAAGPPLRGRRGLRIALLSLAAAILLLGAAIAGVFGYQAIRPLGMAGLHPPAAAAIANLPEAEASAATTAIPGIRPIENGLYCQLRRLTCEIAAAV